jgi:hypothetical protein
MHRARVILIQVNTGSAGPTYSLACQAGRDREMENRYWVALFKGGGADSGVERELAREDRLDIALARYKQSAAMYPNRLVMLCDRAKVLARTDRHPAYAGLRRAG